MLSVCIIIFYISCQFQRLHHVEKMYEWFLLNMWFVFVIVHTDAKIQWAFLKLKSRSRNPEGHVKGLEGLYEFTNNLTWWDPFYWCGLTLITWLLFFVWRKHENMSLCTGSRVKNNYEWTASCAGSQFEKMGPRVSRQLCPPLLCRES